MHGEEERGVLSLRAKLSGLRGKSIHLVPMTIPGHSVNGMWISTNMADFIIYEARTTRAHQEHIIAHELAHMLCGHQAVDNADNTVLRQLFPDIAPEVVRRVLLRTRYSDSNEQEAEMMASLLLARGRQPHDAAPPLHCSDDEVVSRLRAAIATDQPPRFDAVR
ncbi:ImmA/IrrE family metallo-endopeptidase [Streptomyces sp. NPDC085946]|uniref:ImmA/IrrE family metallo-endopeptidase n=1 Tax=Streptomyces sp. NPDC085946 TaxID=3365744 RepID=UPI0037D4F481